MITVLAAWESARSLDVSRSRKSNKVMATLHQVVAVIERNRIQGWMMSLNQKVQEVRVDQASKAVPIADSGALRLGASPLWLVGQGVARQGQKVPLHAMVTAY